ncbi:MAG: phage minor capsid protein [Blautia sp.]|uniref:phage minor capsid protein n=1 Tax=Blautia sp. TaxID=1955243 RepID=UPI0025861F25|nr:phage minor capsid protein [Blautia sp.]MCI6120658.1 phage minor capsid protein [Lachnospiraceae bacterium]MCI7289945.1 phage minor capsid protein [Blautia sp.]
MNQDYKEKLSRSIENKYSNLEMRIMEDIVRRIKQYGKITSTADWQINRLVALGNSSEDIEKMLKETLDASYPEMFELYDKVIDWEYVRNKDIYEQINARFIPYEENEQLQQLTDALRRQTQEELENITRSLGFYLDYGNGKRVLTPLAQVYQGYLDNAVMDIAIGAFDYNSTLRRVVTQLTNSGLRTIDYASGRSYRVNVAARMAVMTGISQLTGRISDMNAEKLGTEYFEVAWHSGARPSHAEWQGRVWSKQQLYDVCGLGTVTGLLGANCYHEYYPFFPGISERNWSDEWLEEQNRKENTPKKWKGKEYTTYEAKQRQRQMETAMRAQRENVQLLQKGDADPDEVMLARCKYQAQLDEYSRFSKKMGLKQERDRIYIDKRGFIASNTKKENAKYTAEMIRNATMDSKQYERYKNIVGDSAGTLANFRQMKYNNPKKFGLLTKKVNTYSEINKKDWTGEFKQKSKEAYDKFSNKNIYLSVHALSRLPRLNKSGYVNVVEDDLFLLLKGKANYTEENKLVYFDEKLQLAVAKNKETGDIVSIIRRKKPKGIWEDV